MKNCIGRNSLDIPVMCQIAKVGHLTQAKTGLNGLTVTKKRERENHNLIELNSSVCRFSIDSFY